jgi:IMP dehydrogenase
MMNLTITEALTFDDVLLKPAYSNIASRSQVDLSVSMPKGFKFQSPITPANMKTITSLHMAEAMWQASGMALVHRFMPIADQLEITSRLQKVAKTNRLSDPMRHVGFSLGIKQEDRQNARWLVEAGAQILCIDVAHGDSQGCVEMCEFLSANFPHVLLIAGNVATGSGAKRLWEAGADVCKIGVGSGSICSTRLQTGNGVPQLSALIEAVQAKQELMSWIDRPIAIISDGGCKTNGDLVKALCFSEMVMTGNMFASADETPGTSYEVNGELVKDYHGSSTHKDKHIEGVKAYVPVKGKVADILDEMHQAIRSGCSYQGVSNLLELKENVELVKITNAGLRESGIHDVLVGGQ